MPGDIIAGFGPRLKAARTALGMRQSDVSDILGITKFAVSNWECGDTCPTLAMFQRLCASTGISADHLLDLDRLAVSPEEYALIERIRKLGPVRRRMLDDMISHLDDLRPAPPADD